MVSNIKNGVQKGFTLIELLIVIAILAILTTIVVVVLNPAELLAQGRDSQRLSDLSSLTSATNLYLKDKGCVATTNVWGAAAAVIIVRNSDTSGTPAGNRTFGASAWLPLDYTTMSTGAPFPLLPQDPKGVDATYNYDFGGDNVDGNASVASNPVGLKCGFELNANMESTVFSQGGSDDKESNSKDGGNNDTLYETGTDPGLDLLD